MLCLKKKRANIDQTLYGACTMAVVFVARNQCILLNVKLRFKKLCEMVSTAHEVQICKLLFYRLFGMAYTVSS